MAVAYPSNQSNCLAGPVTSVENSKNKLNGEFRTRIREELDTQQSASDLNGDPVINITITLGHTLPDYL